MFAAAKSIIHFLLSEVLACRLKVGGDGWFEVIFNVHFKMDAEQNPVYGNCIFSLVFILCWSFYIQSYLI